jgi:hypothetical protein
MLLDMDNVENIETEEKRKSNLQSSSTLVSSAMTSRTSRTSVRYQSPKNVSFFRGEGLKNIRSTSRGRQYPSKLGSEKFLKSASKVKTVESFYSGLKRGLLARKVAESRGIKRPTER